MPRNGLWLNKITFSKVLCSFFFVTVTRCRLPSSLDLSTYNWADDENLSDALNRVDPLAWVKGPLTPKNIRTDLDKEEKLEIRCRWTFI